MGRDAVETAYFTLLRAREELDGLRRYSEYLQEEQRRIRRYLNESAALADTVDPRHRRGVRHTDASLVRAFDDRLEVIANELSRIPERIAGAEAFVDQCEHEHAQLAAGG